MIERSLQDEGIVMFLKSYLSAAVIGATVLLSACGNSIDESNTVRVIVNNADGGTVTVDHLSYCVPEFDCPTIGHKPASADCEFDESCEVRYVLRNSTAQLSATPWPGYEFVGWSEACTGTDANCSLNVGEENPQVTAVFNYIGGDHPFDSQISIIDDTLRGCVLYPAHKEDRELVQLAQLPLSLPQALITVEDQNFYEHYGVSFRGITRAFIANLKERKLVQGGSTLTQQLVKNFYLNQERTLTRKLMEAVMAILMEIHFSKDEILETYINEVYLGQAGDRAIHGFGLASSHYFRQPVKELRLHQTALLAGLVKGASYYNPWRHPERALTRRNLVLDVMAREGVITKAEATTAKRKPLDVVPPRPGGGRWQYPAYLDLVKRQLREDYDHADLQTEGLRVFTNFEFKYLRINGV